MSDGNKIRALIVEDDFGSRRYLQTIMQSFSRCDVVVDGQEAIDAFNLAWEENDPYRVILLDIMMPNMDGQTALREIRAAEKRIGVHRTESVKVVMTTALEDPKNVVEAYYQGGADSYLVKPIERDRLLELLKELQLPIE